MSTQDLKRSCAKCREFRPEAEFKLGFARWSPECAGCRKAKTELRQRQAELRERQKAARRVRAKAAPPPPMPKRVEPGRLATPAAPPPPPPCYEARPPRTAHTFTSRPGAMDAYRLPSLAMGRREFPASEAP